MLDILVETITNIHHILADPGTAIVVASLVMGGAAVASAAMSKPDKAKAPTITGGKDSMVVTPKGITKKNARAALVVGSPKGVLSTEDQTATSGRGTLLGN